MKRKGAGFSGQAGWRTGSFTVEASLLLPFLIFLIFVFFVLSLYLHDRSVLASCAAELAGKGAHRKYETDEHLESWLAGQARGLADEKLLLLRLTEAGAEVEGRSVTVFYEGSTSLLGGLEVWEEETAKRLTPYVEEECDRLMYDGSMIYDEYPDPLQLRLICRRVFDRASEDEEKPGSWMQDLIQVMTYQEILRRRSEYRSSKRRFY